MTRRTRVARCPQLIRPATAGDVSAIAGLIAAGSDEPWSGDLVARLLAVTGGWGLVATGQPPQPDGVLLARTAADEAELLNLVVRPEARRRGIGGTLLLAALRLAAERGAAAMLLEVGVDNAPARALYEKFGFRSVGRRPDYYTRSVDIRTDALIMLKQLITLRNE